LALVKLARSNPAPARAWREESASSGVTRRTPQRLPVGGVLRGPGGELGVVDLAGWHGQLPSEVASRFAQVQSRRRARLYLLGLLSGAQELLDDRRAGR
jgi:hypothetical protein